jgi:hypothetical protein
MTSKPLLLPEPAPLQRSAHGPHRSAFETAAGSLILHRSCSPSLLASLKVDRGLHAFARVPDFSNAYSTQRHFQDSRKEYIDEER